MPTEAIVFVSFLGLQAVFYCVGKHPEFVILHRLSENHWFVWLFHPVVVHSTHDYIVHFFVYSGYIVGTH